MKPLKLCCFFALFSFSQFIVAQSSVPFQDPDGALWGLKDSVDGKVLKEPIFDNIYSASKITYFVRKRGKCGLVV